MLPLLAKKAIRSSRLVCAGSGFILFLAGAACERKEPPREASPKALAPPAASSAAPPARIGLQKSAPPGVTPDAWKAGGKCNIEAVDGVVFDGKPLALKNGTHATLTGWALDPEGTAAPDVVHVRLSSPAAGEFYGSPTRRFVREDVNQSNPVQAKPSAQSGFELSFDADQLPEGSYAVTTVMQIGREVYVCDNGRKVTRLP
jgi:hypothetical protein